MPPQPAVPPTIIRTTDRPDLVPIVAHWLWHAFGQHEGQTLQQTRATIEAATAQSGPPQTFILLDPDGQPQATASLTRTDLAERPNLTPWLAGVYVLPEARGQGHATHLVATVEAACRAARIPTLWLYTHTAETLYARAGWSAVETIPRVGIPTVTLMRRDLPLEHARQVRP